MPTGDGASPAAGGLPRGPQTFGVWLEAAPFAPLRGEGISQLLVQLLRGAAERPGQKVVVACASWTAPDLRRLAAEYDAGASVELLVASERTPMFLRLKEALRTRRREKRRGRAKRARWSERLRAGLLSFGERLVAPWLAGRSWPSFLAGSLLSFVVWTLLAVPLLAACIPLLAGAALKRLRGAAGRLASGPSAAALQSHVQTAVQSLVATAYEKILAMEYRALSRLARRRRDVTAWFIPTPWSKGPTDVGAPLVAALPDLVYVDCPTLFSEGMESVDGRIQALASKAAALVTYGEHVRTEQAERRLGFPRDRVHVVRHAAMDLRGPLRKAAGGRCDLKGAAGPDERAALAACIQHWAADFRRRAADEPSADFDYLHQFPFDEVDFLFVSSQTRPHKTLRNVLAAFDHLLRRRYRPLKLFTTGRLSNAPETLQYVRERRLERDVLSAPDLPAEVHAAFYRLAKLTVVPSLFEGGFPFPFTESLSVDTPVVMSSMPCTRELLPPETRPRILFDPYDPADLAEKIAWGLDHRDALLAVERPIYAEMAQRTWSVVAGEYLDVFAEVARRDAAEKAAGASLAPHPLRRAPRAPAAGRASTPQRS